MSMKKLSDRMEASRALGGPPLSKLRLNGEPLIDAVRALESQLEQARGYLENEELTDTVARFMALAVLHGGG